LTPFQERRNFAAAIHAIQITLRVDPDDAQSWIRLGEAYKNSGRHAAALKALGRAQQLQDDPKAIYFLGEVYRDTGDFYLAIDAFRETLVKAGDGIGARIVLGQTYLDLGHAEIRDGFTGRAEQSFCLAVETCLSSLQGSPGLRGMLWKTIADSLFMLCLHSSSTSVDAVHDIFWKVINALNEASVRIPEFISLPSLTDGPNLSKAQLLAVAAAAYDHRLSLDITNDSAAGSAWYDFGSCLRFMLASEKLPDLEKRGLIEDQVTRCLAEAVKLDSAAELHWIALGDSHFLSNVQSAQHAYVKALEFNSQVCCDRVSVIIWAQTSFSLSKRGLISDFSIYTTVTLSSQMKLSIEHKLLILILHLLGSAKLSWPSRTKTKTRLELFCDMSYHYHQQWCAHFLRTASANG
jgi:superkiller protein 3